MPTAANNAVSFVRGAPDGVTLVCVANFSVVALEGYRIGLPAAGRWAEVLNTDSHHYGSSGVGEPGRSGGRGRALTRDRARPKSARPGGHTGGPCYPSQVRPLLRSATASRSRSRKPARPLAVPYDAPADPSPGANLTTVSGQVLWLRRD